MISTIIMGVFTYMATTLLGYALHWAIHQPWMGPLYRAHRTHHVTLYPAHDLVSKEYRDAGSQSTVWTFLLAFLPFIALPIVIAALGWIGWTQSLVIVAAMGFVGVLNDVYHDSFHVKDHWLGRLTPGYKTLRRRHFLHHVYTL